MTGGELSVGIFDGSFVQTAGTLGPGSSPGTTIFTGDCELDGGTIELELGGLTQGAGIDGYDFVSVMGDFNVTSGTLNVLLFGGFNPESGNVFDVFTFGSQTGTFTAVNLPTLSSGLEWDRSELYTTGMLSVSSVPEPTSLILFGSLGLLCLRRHRCKV